MNRWDEIKGLARNIASNVHAGPVTVVVSSAKPRSCCYLNVCATCRNGGPAGPCCYPLGGVCRFHH